MQVGGRAGSIDIGTDDKRLLEYLMMNWRMSLLNAYLNGGLDKYEELARAINRCSVIMDVLRDESNATPQIVLAEQLSRLASELGDIVGEDEDEAE
ncbi:MAG TPA: hypothetical protein ENO38_01265 [Nitrososphaeria archaeon]|jgi:hypothetical protein|nr:hypothetical protein [Conexivisphaerales archaeon]PMP94148.1 MAG: hypothetical protein C0167_04325 [Nitrososphaera sp.]HEU16285.1 hypothetical protein [Nitrososphaeria archaeon]